MRGRLALAGIDPATTPLDEFIDIEWALLCDLVGPPIPEDPERLARMWSELTGTPVEHGGGAPVDGGERRGDQATVDAVRNLADDDLAAWVPAYRRLLDGDGSDDELAMVDAAWHHTAAFAGGQDALTSSFPDASRKRGKAKRPAAAPEPQDAPTGGPFGTSEFGMPEGMS